MDGLDPRSATGVWHELSAAQRSVWLDMQVQDATEGYQLGGWARMDTGLDIELAVQAVGLVMARHDGLRLEIDREQPRQRIVRAPPAPVGVHDLSHQPDPHAAFEAFRRAAFATGFRLGEGLLVQIDFVRAGARCWYLLWRCHHLIADSISVAVAHARWTEAYNALAGDGDGELAALTSFVGSLESEQIYEASAAATADLDYWCGRLATVPPPLFAHTQRGEIAPPIQWRMEAARYRQLTAACRRCGVTTQRAVLDLTASALARLYQQRNVSLGVAVRRRGPATRETLGMFAGLLPVRIAIDMEQSLGQIAAAAAAQLDRDFRHQRVPIDRLTRALKIERPQLAETVVSHLLEDAEPAALTLGGAPVASGLFRGEETAPLALHVLERPYGDTIGFELAGNAAFVDGALLRRLATALRLTFECFADDPSTVLDEIDLLSEADRALVVSGWNPPPAVFPIAPLPLLFAAQAARLPEAPAVVEGVRSLSYGALDAASSALAARLQAQGVGLETVVGVALARSIETVVCGLAILKAGGVYLPLDPAYPDERLAFMLADAGARLVLADDATAARLPGGVTCLAPQGGGGERLRPVALQPGHLAYIVYTSGSTGRPKEVGVSHAAAANVAFARRAGHDPIGPGDRVLAAISVGFDVSIGQLLLPLLSGATIVVAPDLRTLSGEAFWTLLQESRVSHVNSVPSFFDSVLGSAPAESGLRRLMLGGEALSGALVRRLQAALPGTAVVNMYGPTEACIDATAHVVSRFPRGVGRDRDGAVVACVGGAGGGGGGAGRAGRAAAGRLRGRDGGCGGVAGASVAASAGSHDPGPDRQPGRHAADAERKTRSQGAAGAEIGEKSEHRAAPHDPRNAASDDLVRRARDRQRRRHG